VILFHLYDILIILICTTCAILVKIAEWVKAQKCHSQIPPPPQFLLIRFSWCFSSNNVFLICKSHFPISLFIFLISWSLREALYFVCDANYTDITAIGRNVVVSWLCWKYQAWETFAWCMLSPKYLKGLNIFNTVTWRLKAWVLKLERKVYC
jgi:hypothetical protein